MVLYRTMNTQRSDQSMIKVFFRLMEDVLYMVLRRTLSSVVMSLTSKQKKNPFWRYIEPFSTIRHILHQSEEPFHHAKNPLMMQSALWVFMVPYRTMQVTGTTGTIISWNSFVLFPVHFLCFIQYLICLWMRQLLHFHISAVLIVQISPIYITWN